MKILETPSERSTVEADPLGYVHSIDTGSMVDGPGMRVVVFLSGCAVQCSYCHNADTWKLKLGTPMRVSAVISEIRRYASFIKAAHGGVTISGGEPLLQAQFLVALVRSIKEEGLHVTLETSGNGFSPTTAELISLVDLFIIDLKGFSSQCYESITKKSRESALQFCERVASEGRPIWLSHVLIKGVSDDPQTLSEMAAWAQQLGAVERILIRPLHLYGAYKWNGASKPYPYSEKDVPNAEDIQGVRNVFIASGIRAD